MRTSRKNKGSFPLKVEQLKEVLMNNFENNTDLNFSIYKQNDQVIGVFYIDYLVESEKINDYLLTPLLNKDTKWSSQSIMNEIPLSQGKITSTIKDILKEILVGKVFVYVEGEKEVISYILINKEKRAVQVAESESIVLGPKIAFTESIFTNLNIIRFRIRSNDLVLEEISVGNSIPREVRLVYLKSVANEADVNTMRQRLTDLDIDEIEDSTILMQYIEDKQSSLFPQFDSTELPDRFTYAIAKGKVGVLVENSPTGFIGPVSLFSFLESTEDIYMRWQVGTFLRLLRFIAMFLSVFITPLYVAIVTFQYSMIPMDLLVSLGKSRAVVPFPPLIEALVLEFLLELLREAGARLPTKVGQTMGVVGGIVIGQAAVQAGLTSNILIIAVAASALASFTSPSYSLGSAVRFIRFPLIILAATYSLIGLMFGICFVLIHLLRTTSLGRPYLAPLYPLQLKDFNKVFYRTPLKYYNKRAKMYRPKQRKRFSKKKASKINDLNE